MNQVLEQIKEQTEAKVPTQMREAFDRAVIAGMKIMHDEKTHDMAVKQLQREGDPADNLGEGIAKLVAILMKTNDKVPAQVVVLAGVVLLCEAIDFIEQGGLIEGEVDKNFVAEATKSFISSLLQLLKIDPDKIPQIMEEATRQQPQQQPQQPQQPPQAAPAPQGIIGQQQGA